MTASHDNTAGGVIFDMDGVLVDSYHAHFESWRTMAANHGVTMTEKQFAATFGQTSRQIIRDFWPHATDEQVAAWDTEKESLYRDILRSDFREIDGASDLVRALRMAGFALAVGSSGPAANVQATMECLPAGKLFDATVCGCDVTHGKPAPDIFLTAADKLGLSPRRCVVVEDAPVGVAAARAAGMPVVGLTGTVGREQLADADLVVDSLRALTPADFRGLIDAAG